VPSPVGTKALLVVPDAHCPWRERARRPSTARHGKNRLAFLHDLFPLQPPRPGGVAFGVHLDALPGEAGDRAVVRARGHLARQEFAAARALLETTIARFPQSLRAHVLLSHVLLREGRDWAAAENALRAVLALDPENAEARRNRALLIQERGSNGA
jgi:Tfp pilus assembly protein PilF